MEPPDLRESPLKIYQTYGGAGVRNDYTEVWERPLPEMHGHREEGIQYTVQS